MDSVTPLSNASFDDAAAASSTARDYQWAERSQRGRLEVRRPAVVAESIWRRRGLPTESGKTRRTSPGEMSPFLTRRC